MASSGTAPALRGDASFARALRPALALFSIAIAARALLISFALYGHRGSIERYLLMSDAPSYVAVARMLVTGARNENLWHERVFIGWPLTLALPGAVFGYEAACLLLAALLAALVPVVWWKLTADRASSLALTVLTPTWLMHSSLGMSESAFLLYQVVALWTCVRGRLVVASVFAGAAMIVRPNGAFVWLAIAYAMSRRRAWRALAAHCAIAAACIAAVVAFNLHFYGDALRQSHVYSGWTSNNTSPEAAAALARLPFSSGPFSLPMLHLIATPFMLHVPAWKVVFVWTHALLVFLACAFGLRDMRRIGWRHALAPNAASSADPASELGAMTLIWALLNTAFILSTGAYWGFHSFDRYCVWALPAYLYLARAHLPQRTAFWIALGVASLALAMWSQARAF